MGCFGVTLLWWYSPPFKITAHLQGTPAVEKRNRWGQGEHMTEKLRFCLCALAWPGMLSKVGTGVQEPAEEVGGHWHSQQGTAEHRNYSLGSCWVPVGHPDLLAFPVPPSTQQCKSNPSPKFKLHGLDTQWARQKLRGAEQVMPPIKFQGGSLVSHASKKQKG